MRYVIEGEWSGYTSSQQRIVHCHVTKNGQLVEWVQKTYCIRYTDGTTLNLSARLCKPRERVKENPSYLELIEECFRAGVSSVAELATTRKCKN